jgi:hypothetical protein
VSAYLPSRTPQPIGVLKRIASDNRKKWELALNPHREKNMYIFGISVDPLEQRKSVVRLF